MADNIQLVNTTQLNANLKSVADAIRTKSGATGQLIFPTGFINAINDITPASDSELEISTLSSNSGDLYFTSNGSYWDYNYNDSNQIHTFDFNEDIVILGLNLIVYGNSYDSTSQLSLNLLNIKNNNILYNGIPTSVSYTEDYSYAAYNLNLQYDKLSFTVVTAWNGASKLTLTITGRNYPSSDPAVSGNSYDGGFNRFKGTIKYVTKGQWQEWLAKKINS